MARRAALGVGFGLALGVGLGLGLGHAAAQPAPAAGAGGGAGGGAANAFEVLAAVPPPSTPVVWEPAVSPYGKGNYASPDTPNGPPVDWSWMNSPLANRTGELSTEAQLKLFLGIGNSSVYDRSVYPFDIMWAAKGQSGKNRTGLDIAVSLNFHRVYIVDQRTSTADLSVWMRQEWYDPRLVWNPADWNGLDRVFAWGGSGKPNQGDIWVPDIELWNAVSTPQTTFTQTYAEVASNGRVKWDRPGRLKIMCNFKGLREFPFDELLCRAELGSWLHGEQYLRVLPMNGLGWSAGGSATAGQRYEEFRLSDIKCQYHLYTSSETATDEKDFITVKPNFSKQNHAVLWYDISFTRAWRPHVLTFVIIQMLLNLLSFSAFWLPTGSGARPGMGITAMLTAVTNQLVMEGRLPPCQEWTWASRLGVVSLAFTALSLLETVVVQYFNYKTETDMTPLLFTTCDISLCCGQVPDHHNHPLDDYTFDQDKIASGDELARVASHHNPHRHAWGTRTWKGDSRSRKVAEEFLNRIEEENNRYWQKVARWVDEVARWVIPTTYVVIMAVMLGTQNFRHDVGLLEGPEYEGYKADPNINVTTVE